MNLLQYDKENFDVTFSPELVLLSPFRKIVERDKSKNKSIAKKEIGFIYHFADIRSDYLDILDEEKRISEIIHDLELPKDWKVDKIVQEAIDFYKKRSTTINSTLYESACIAAIEISSYLRETKSLLEERTDKGAAVTNINSITGALAKVPDIMRNLTAAHVELIKEQKITEGRKKGSKDFNMYEDGLSFEDE